MFEPHTPDPSAPYRRLLVYGDPSPRPGPEDRYAAYGSLWIPWERRGDLLRILRALRDRHAYLEPILELLVAAPEPHAEAFALDLIDEVFRRRWISFRCLVTRASGAEASNETVLCDHVARRFQSMPGEIVDRELRFRLPRASPRALAQSILARLTTTLGAGPHLSVRPARTHEAIALVQFLTALIVDDWEKKPVAPHRRRFSLRAAENLGWSDLAGDTYPSEWKFNIAYVADPSASAPPSAPQRSVQLRLRLVD